MATTRVRLGCPVCGLVRDPQFFGLDETGAYDPAAHTPKFVAKAVQFAGRARITVTDLPVTLEFAQGLRSALRASLAVLEAEILDAGGELEP